MDNLLNYLAACFLIWCRVHRLDWQGDALGLGVVIILRVWVKIMLVNISSSVIRLLIPFFATGSIRGLNSGAGLDIFCHGSSVAFTWDQFLLCPWILD